MIPTQAYLKYLFDYDAATGICTRRAATSNRVKVGDAFGCLNAHGYLIARVNDTLYPVHRLVWLWMTGVWCLAEIDHINRIRNDNRWINLREVTASQNAHNIVEPSHNTSGHLGISWDKANNKWRAQLVVNGKSVNVGRFTDIDDAITARKQAELAHHPTKPQPG